VEGGATGIGNKGFQLVGFEESAPGLHRAFEHGGEKESEQFQLKDIQARARKHYISPFDIAFQYGLLGDKDETLKFLSEAYQERCPRLIFWPEEPVFDFLHSGERYRELVKKIGLPPAWDLNAEVR
jgi:hypothetical protein